MLVTPAGKLPSVPTRGADLNGSTLPAQRDSTDSNASSKSSMQNGAHGQYRPQVVMQPCPWLAFEGRWGSTVLAPACQDWWVDCLLSHCYYHKNLITIALQLSRKINKQMQM